MTKGTVALLAYYVILLFLRWVFTKWHLAFVISAKTCSSALLRTQFKILSVWHIKLLCILNVEATIFWFVHILDFTEPFSLVQIISIILLHILGISFIRIILGVIWIVTGSIQTAFISKCTRKPIVLRSLLIKIVWLSLRFWWCPFSIEQFAITKPYTNFRRLFTNCWHSLFQSSSFCLISVCPFSGYFASSSWSHFVQGITLSKIFRRLIVTFMFSMWSFISFLVLDKVHHGHSHHLFHSGNMWCYGFNLFIDLVVDLLPLSCRLLWHQQVIPIILILKLVLIDFGRCLWYPLFLMRIRYLKFAENVTIYIVNWILFGVRSRSNFSLLLHII